MSKTFANSINSNPLYAERAEQDASGNTITTTYATKSEVSAVADVPDVTSSDNGKVLKATYEGGAGSYAWANETGTTYTAGYGIGIDPNDNNAIHVNPDGILGGISVTSFGVGAKYDGTTINVNSNRELQVVNPLPTSNSADSTKVLTVDSKGAPVWAAAQSGTTYSAGDGIDITNDTISADVDGTTIGIDSSTKKIKLLASIPTVDQTYSAASTNAQSGVAVASAIAAVPSKPLVAGSNITITENTNNVTIAATAATVDQTYSASSTNAQSGAAVAGALATVDEVPAVTSSDDGKILKASYSGGSGSYAWSAEPTVDQTYSASSTNAQSGLAVAGAIASISVDEVPAVTSSDDAKVLTATYSGGVGSYAWATPSGGGSGNDIFWAEFGKTSFNDIWTAVSAGKTVYMRGAGEFPTSSTGTVTYARLQYIEKSSWGGVLSKAIFVRTTGSGNASKLNAEITAFTVNGNDIWTSGYTQGCLLPMPSISESGKVLKVDSSGDAEWASLSVDEVPAVTSSDDGKVLMATYSGGTGSYAWAAASGGTTYTAGNMVSIDANNNNAIGVSTTAGITDIQQVASLPANPVSTVLYLIPET